MYWGREPQLVFQARNLGRFVHPDDIRDSRVWTAREYLPHFVGSGFSNNKGLFYGPSRFGEHGATLQWWPKKEGNITSRNFTGSQQI